VTAQSNPRANQAWRLLIRVSAFVSFAIGVFWTLIAIGAGSMGWSGRSDSQVWALLIGIVFVPSLLTIALALKATFAADEPRLTRAARFCLLSWLPVPAAWLVETLRLVPF
jgi:hypothetical protein